MKEFYDTFKNSRKIKILANLDFRLISQEFIANIKKTDVELIISIFQIPDDCQMFLFYIFRYYFDCFHKTIYFLIRKFVIKTIAKLVIDTSEATFHRI